MTDYRIEAATKEEWAERALRAEAKLAKAVATLEYIAKRRGLYSAKKTLVELKGEDR